MGTDVAEVVENLPSPYEIKLHRVMCTELMRLVERVDRIFPEIEAARPRCTSGIQTLCLITGAIKKAKTLIHDCCESSKLYLALTGNTILSRCKKSKNLLEQGLTQIQTMVPVILASKISKLISELRLAKFSLDKCEEEAGKTVRTILEGYRNGNHLEKQNNIEYIRIAAQKLQLTSNRALLSERRSIKKLLKQIGEENSKLPKKQILLFLLDLLNKYTISLKSGCVENDSVVQTQDYDSRMVDFYVDREQDPPEEFKCWISQKLMYDPVIIDSGQTYERMWIQKWFDEGHDICPKTNKRLTNTSLIPNTAMKDLISKWCETHGVTVSDPFFQLPNNTWENSSSSINSLSSMYSLQLPVDYSNLSLTSLDNSQSQIVDDSREFEVGFSLDLDDTIPWEFQCKFVEDLMTRLKNDDEGCRMMSSEKIVESVVRFLTVARDVNDVKAQRIGCLLLLILVTKCRCIKYLSKDAYVLIAEFLESEVIEEALAIIEELSSHQNYRSEIASSSAFFTRLFKILDIQLIQIQTLALKILYNLTSTRNVRSLISSSDLIPKLVTLSEDESLSRYCIAVLTNLCGNQDNKSIIAETNGCISFIAKILESESCDEQEQALEIFLSLCSQSVQYCRLVMDEGVIPDLVSISINGNDKGKAKAQEMLRLLKDIHHEDYVEESNAPVYDVPEDPESVQLEKRTSSKASRFLSKFSLVSKSKASLAHKRKV